MLKLFKIKTIAEAKELKANGQDLSTDFEKGYLKFQVDSMDLDHGVAKRSAQEGTPDREAAARSKAVAQNGNGHNGTKIMATWAKRIAWAPITIGKCWKSRNHPYTSLHSHEISWIVNVSVSGQEDAQSVQWYPQQVSTVLFPFPVCTQKTFCFLPNSVLWRILLRWLEHVYEYVICDQHWPTTLRSLEAQKTVITHNFNQCHTCSTSIPSAGFPRLPGTSWRTFEQLACHKRRRLFCSTCWQCHCYCNSTISKWYLSYWSFSSELPCICKDCCSPLLGCVCARALPKTYDFRDVSKCLTYACCAWVPGLEHTAIAKNVTWRHITLFRQTSCFEPLGKDVVTE